MPVPVNWDTFTWDATTTTAGPAIDTLTTAVPTIDMLKQDATDERNWTHWIRAGEITADTVRTVDDRTVVRYAPGYAPINNAIWDDWDYGSISFRPLRPQSYEDEEDDICVDEKSWDGFINSDYE